MAAFLISFLLTILAIILVVALVNWARQGLDKNKRRLVESERSLGKAERALRSIANGAANPVLEAQIGLDEITSYHEKELS